MASQMKFNFSAPDVVKPAPAPAADAQQAGPIPQSQSITHPQSLRLTQFDENHVYYFPAVLLYRLENLASVYDCLVARLKISLAQALVLFYPMAGRVVKSSESSQVQILCTDEGVPFVEAQVEEKMDDALFAGGEYQSVPQLSGFDALGLPYRNSNLDPPGVPAFIVQVTRFNCGAVALGLTWHHCCADGEAFTQFMKAWTDISISGHTYIVPDHDRAAVRLRVESTKPKEPSTNVNQMSNSTDVSTDLKPLSDLSLKSALPRTESCIESLANVMASNFGENLTEPEIETCSESQPLTKLSMVHERTHPLSAGSLVKQPAYASTEPLADLQLRSNPNGETQKSLLTNPIWLLKKSNQESITPAALHLNLESDSKEIQVDIHASTSTLVDANTANDREETAAATAASTAGKIGKQSVPDQTQAVQHKVYKIKLKWIEELQKATNDSPQSLSGRLNSHLTKVDCITAHIWRCVARALMAKRKVSLTSIWTAVEGRRRLFSPPLSQHYFGNVLVLAWLGLAYAPDLERNPLSLSAHLIHKAVHRISPASYWLIIRQKEELLAQIQMGKDLAGMVSFTSWTRFPLYDLDFGYGRPFWAATNVILGKVKNAVLLPTPPGSSFVPVQLFLMPDIWEAISSDPEFVDAEDRLATFI